MQAVCNIPLKPLITCVHQDTLGLTSKVKPDVKHSNALDVTQVALAMGSNCHRSHVASAARLADPPITLTSRSYLVVAAQCVECAC